MAAQIIALSPRRRPAPSPDWTRQELAEFYRVESALLQAGLELESDRGVSDEGDPWFVFCRADTGEVFIHFAREDGQYVVDGAALGAPARGRDFGALVRDLITRHPLAHTRRPGSNIMLHPAALLIALVGAAFFHSGRAKAAEVAHAPGESAPAPAGREGGRRDLLVATGSAAPAAGEGRAITLDAAEVAAVLTAVAIGMGEGATPPAATLEGEASAPVPATSSAAFSAPGLLADRLGRPAGADVLAALSAPSARAALTVMAVIRDLAHATPAAATEASSVAAPAPVAAAVATLSTAAPDAPSPSSGVPAPSHTVPALLIHLAAGPMPQIEALALVSADGALARVSADRVVHVDQLPSLLADLISHGEINVIGGGGGGGGSGAGGGDAPPPPGTGSDPGAAGPVTPGPTPHPETSPAAAAPADPSVATSAAAPPPSAVTHDGADAGTGGAATTSPAAPTAEPSPPSVVPPAATGPATPSAPAPVEHPAAAAGHSPQIDAAVLAFVNGVQDVQVMITGHDVVFYDPRILTVLAPGDVLDSVSWRLEDGSTVSLVGTTAELHTFHGLG